LDLEINDSMNIVFEFRTVNRNARTLECEFGEAKKKGAGTNVFINITSDISKKKYGVGLI